MAADIQAGFIHRHVERAGRREGAAGYLEPAGAGGGSETGAVAAGGQRQRGAELRAAERKRGGRGRGRERQHRSADCQADRQCSGIRGIANFGHGQRGRILTKREPRVIQRHVKASAPALRAGGHHQPGRTGTDRVLDAIAGNADRLGVRAGSRPLHKRLRDRRGSECELVSHHVGNVDALGLQDVAVRVGGTDGYYH